MRGEAGPWLLDSWIDGMLATRPYVALHTGVPSPEDPTATECVGAWYARKAMTWDALDETAVANAAPVKWTSMPNISIVGVALYTTSTGALLMIWAPYGTPVYVETGGSLTIAAHDLYVEMV